MTFNSIREFKANLPGVNKDVAAETLSKADDPPKTVMALFDKMMSLQAKVLLLAGKSCYASVKETTSPGAVQSTYPQWDNLIGEIEEYTAALDFYLNTQSDNPAIFQGFELSKIVSKRKNAIASFKVLVKELNSTTDEEEKIKLKRTISLLLKACNQLLNLIREKIPQIPELRVFKNAVEVYSLQDVTKQMISPRKPPKNNG